MSCITGQPVEILKDHFTPGKGPTIVIDNEPVYGMRNPSLGVITVDPSIITRYSGGTSTETGDKTLIMLFSINLIHEETHNADRLTNDGNITGDKSDIDMDPYGKQNISSDKNHRGLDMESAIMGVEISTTDADAGPGRMWKFSDADFVLVKKKLYEWNANRTVGDEKKDNGTFNYSDIFGKALDEIIKSNDGMDNVQFE